MMKVETTEIIGFGAMDNQFPFEFIAVGPMDDQFAYERMGFG